MGKRVPLGQLGFAAVWIVIGLAMPYILGHNPYRLGQLNYILALTMLSVGLNIVLGFTGVLFLGPGALFAAGGYAAAAMAQHYTPWQSLPAMCLVSVVISLVLALVAAVPSLRIGGFYLGMVTLFLTLLVPTVAQHWSLVGASNGISLETVTTFVQRPAGLHLYYLGILMLAVLAGYSWLIKRSRLGRQFGTIMASEDLAQSLGIVPYPTKLISFLLAAVPCGVAGAFYVYSQQFISPGSVQPQLSIYILAGMVIGGSGTILGPIIGTALVGAADQFLGSFNEYQGLLYGVALIAVAALLPTGLMGVARMARSRYWRAKPVQSVLAGLEEATVASEVVPVAADGKPNVTLTVKGARRAFGGVTAVAGVDLAVAPGRIHALVGPNGSGKTTLLNLISGFYRLDEGEIWLGEERLDTRRAAGVARLGVARTFQTPKLLLDGLALGNVVIGAEWASAGSKTGSVLRLPRSSRADREALVLAAHSLDTIGLADQENAPAAVMPHGTQRLLEIARAVAMRPKFILLDEPAAGLSVSEVDTLKNAVRGLAEGGMGVLLVEHNLPVVFGLADHVTVLHQGEVIATGTPSEVSANPEVIEVYLGRQHVERTKASPESSVPTAGGVA